MEERPTLTYPEIAAFYNLALSQLGWRDRRMTRSGLRKFLIAVYYHDRGPLRDYEDWELIWRANVWAYREALKRWHRRIPKRYFDEDRTRVAWHISREPSRTPQMRKAWRWANERSPLFLWK